MGGRRSLLGACALTVLAAVLGFAPAAHAQQQATVLANPDSVSTNRDTAVDFDPTVNDTIDAPYVVDHVEIESSPQHGTATVNGDGITIHYVPDAGYVGSDAMMYNLVACVTDGEFQNCQTSTADITIDVVDVVETTTTVAPTTTTTTIAEPTTTVVTPISQEATTTTVAAPSTTVAAAATLPRTGGSSAPLSVVAALAVGLGSLLLAIARRRTRPTT